MGITDGECLRREVDVEGVMGCERYRSMSSESVPDPASLPPSGVQFPLLFGVESRDPPVHVEQQGCHRNIENTTPINFSLAPPNTHWVYCRPIVNFRPLWCFFITKKPEWFQSSGFSFFSSRKVNRREGNSAKPLHMKDGLDIPDVPVPLEINIFNKYMPCTWLIKCCRVRR